ncbi:MAG: glutamate-1-semialdehyde 2,1-aminomutase [Acidobacteriales bacterium]|nr:glutamate-1-semialdehyde 2,1-aminomutase [Terriglobales bacterium]
MYAQLKKELETYERRTPRSRAALEHSKPWMPLGVSSNFRSYEPYPLFIESAQGTRVRDLDGNEYIDFNLCFGALMAGHANPIIVRAVEEQLKKGTMYGMPHVMEQQLAEEICARYPVENVRFGNSGTEVTMHAIRLARGFTGREKIIKFEGCYHGVHDAAMVSVKPKADKWGSATEPNQVPASAGIPKGAWEATLVAIFNDLPSVERLFKKYPGDVAALILEPVPMNIGVCMPQPGFLEGLRELCTRHGALLIYDEVKTGAKLGRGGASEYFGVKPDMVCLAKSIGGGFSLAAFGTSRKIMDIIGEGKVFHAGTYNTNPLVMAAGLATLRHVLTPENYARIDKMSKRLVEGCNQIIKQTGLTAYAIGACANGAVMLYPGEVKNYRDWAGIDVDLWRHYWFAMVNRGVMPTPHYWDEQWTVSVAHSDADIERHLEVFAEVAPALAVAQQERSGAMAAR